MANDVITPSTPPKMLGRITNDIDVLLCTWNKNGMGHVFRSGDVMRNRERFRTADPSSVGGERGRTVAVR